MKWLLCTLLLIAPVAFANIATSSITGRVTIGGKGAAGVSVRAESPALQHPRTTITGPRGTYWLGALPPGEYDVTFSLTGHTTMTRHVIAELARVARSDATLELNADEESVTSTATTPNVTETTAVTTHFDDAMLDRLPLGRTGNLELFFDPAVGTLATLDGLPWFLSGAFESEELLEQATAVRGGGAVDSLSIAGNTLELRSRQGREDFFFSLRGTTSNTYGARQWFEGTAGGPVVRERLWFFAAGWGGETRYDSDLRGLNTKLHAQLGASHHLDASYSGSDQTIGVTGDISSLWLQHTAVAGPRFTWETYAARAGYGRLFSDRWSQAEFLSTRASYVAPTRGGDHVVTGGWTEWGKAFDYRAFFLNDRWSSSRWVVNAGLRYEDYAPGGEFLPRGSVTYDLRGDGRRALAASYGEYAYSSDASRIQRMRITSLGYVTAIGVSGTMRVDVLRRASGASSTDSIQLDARYRLFDRFEAGAIYGYERGYAFRSQHANVWLGLELPVGNHEIGVTVLQRRLDLYNPGTGSDVGYPTDIALRYSIPLRRVRLSLAADAINAFRYGEPGLTVPRELRFWARLSR